MERNNDIPLFRVNAVTRFVSGRPINRNIIESSNQVQHKVKQYDKASNFFFLFLFVVVFLHLTCSEEMSSYRQTMN